jgi:molybdopterin-guanine dinucleotide biosynthesis protein A
VSSIATAFNSPDNEFPEPLITIWEPKSYSILLSFLAQGYSCPRKVLINSDVNLLQAPNPEALTNVNTPEDLEKVKRTIHQKIASA